MLILRMYDLYVTSHFHEDTSLGYKDTEKKMQVCLGNHSFMTENAFTTDHVISNFLFLKSLFKSLLVCAHHSFKIFYINLHRFHPGFLIVRDQSTHLIVNLQYLKEIHWKLESTVTKFLWVMPGFSVMILVWTFCLHS